MPADEAKVSVWDRGFVFGDSVYEVLRVYRGRPWLEDQHIGRLRRSLLSLEFPPIDFDRLITRMRATLQASELGEALIYIQITRGTAPRKHAFPSPPVPPTELIAVLPYDDAETAKSRQTGVPLISYPDLRWARCDVKSTNLLGNVLANEAAHRAGAYEVALVGPDGLVTEATHSSIVWVQGGKVGGTPEGTAILPGTTRGFLIRLLTEERIPFGPGRVTLAELGAADEVFLLGTTIEVLPVVQIDGAPVASGRPGPITCQLQGAFSRAVRQWLDSSHA